MGVFFILVLLLAAALAIYMFKGREETPEDKDEDFIN